MKRANATLDVVLHSFRVSTTALEAKWEHFEQLLEAASFDDGQHIVSRQEILVQKFSSLALPLATELLVIRIEDLGCISAIKSIQPLPTDFLLILHDQDAQATPPVSSLAHRFDALDAVRLYVLPKKVIKIFEAKMQPKQDAGLSEEHVRQRLLVSLLLDQAPWPISAASVSSPKVGSGKKRAGRPIMVRPAQPYQRTTRTAS